MKKKLTLSLLGLSAMGCTGLMIPFTTSCTTKETITIQLQPNIRNGIQTNKDSSVLSIIGYNGEDIDVTKVTYDIKDVPKGVVVKIDGSTLS
ncbi:hypothetical protein FACS1894166_11910 [Bacilli bacterium]|nr:hypothetical protein FACS1894166_11910 [Bacilli bacterium]